METAVTSVDIMDWVLFFLPPAIRPICTRLLQIIGTLVLCWILIRVSSRVVKSFLQRQTKKQYMPITERKANTLNYLGVPSSSLVVVASAASVAIGLGAQGIATDMLGGFFILFEDNYAVGDIVTIQGITGTVESVTLRSTKLRDVQGCVHIIPNGSVGTVTNLCRDYINAIVTVGIAYGESIDHAIAVLTDEMQKTSDMESVLETPVVAGVTGLDDSAVTIKVVAKCKIKTSPAVEAELRRRIKNRFDKEGIDIPFPQRTIHIVQEKEA